MNLKQTPSQTVPSHVPTHLVYDFDFFNPPGGAEDVHLAWKRLHDVAPDIFWTPRNGGHWIATRADDIDVIQADSERFSNKFFVLPVLPLPYPPLPLSLDPPEHAPVRALISPAFSPKAIQHLTEKAREVAITLIDRIAPDGRCEFVGDFAKVLPVVVFLETVGLPPEDRKLLLPLADMIVRNSDKVTKFDAHAKINEYLMSWIERRKRQPGEDLISKIASAQIKGRPITTTEVFGLCSLLLIGGLDTVAGVLSFAALYLAERPELQAEIAADPDIIPAAIEELMRRHGLPNTARTVARDLEYKKIFFKEGDMIQLPRVLYNLDERKIKDPLKVDFHRPEPVPNATFGGGAHRCPGSMLARSEMRVFLEEWFKRIPSFQVAPTFKKRTMSGGVNGIETVDLVWRVASK